MIITLYSKPGCHLCDDVRTLIDELAPEHGFIVEEINIETDAQLLQQLRYEIPLLLMDGKEIARGRIRERDILAALSGG